MLKATMASLTLLLGVVLLAQGQTTDPRKNPNVCVITVVEMHCANCAKRIARHLQEVPGVVQVHYDVKYKMLWVTPGQQLPSPRALWEAVERAEDQPVRLQGPQGVFTTKPQA